MERKKQEILARLQKLNEVSFIKPTARDLHSKRAMLSRVDRQETERYKASVERQKSKLKMDLSKVESYLGRIKRRQDYLARRPTVLPKPEGYSKQRRGDQNLQRYRSYRKSLRNQESYLKKTPEALTQPEVIIGRRPVLKRTRLSRMKRRGRY